MKVTFSEHAWQDYLHWQEHDRKLLLRINTLIMECMRTPFSGRGKPEPLKDNYVGYWSRRITDEDRLVYRVSDDVLLVAQCRYHYRSQRR